MSSDLSLLPGEIIIGGETLALREKTDYIGTYSTKTGRQDEGKMLYFLHSTYLFKIQATYIIDAHFSLLKIYYNIKLKIYISLHSHIFV